MTAGRKPKPAHLKLLAGNPGHRPITPDAEAAGVLDAPPEWFSDEQKAAWRYAISHAPHGVLRMIDQAALTVWIIAEHFHCEATQKVMTNGMVVKSPIKGERIQNPYLAVVNKQAQIMLKAASELGFTPSARARVGGGIRSPGKGNRYDGIGDRNRSA